MSITLQGENRVSLESPVFLSTSSARLFILSSGLYTIYKLTKKQLIGKFFKSFIQDKKKFCLVGQKSQEKKKGRKKKSQVWSCHFLPFFSSFSATKHRINENPQTSTCFLSAEALTLRNGVLWNWGFGRKEDDPCGLIEGRVVLLMELQEGWSWWSQKNCDEAIAMAALQLLQTNPTKPDVKKDLANPIFVFTI